MAIKFPLPPGSLVLCNFDTGFRPPEMVKRRPVVIVSPRLRHRDGLCTVVPLSTTAPRQEVPYVCRLRLPEPLPAPWAAAEVWAKADMLATVCFDRLDLFRTGRGEGGKRIYLKRQLHPDELARIRACISVALGLGAP